MRGFLILAAPVMLAAGPALAQEAAVIGAPAAVAAPAAPAEPAAAPAKPKKICRKYAVTGHRIADTTCYTAQQWAEYDRLNSQAARKFINDVTGAAGSAHFPGGSDGGLETSTLFGLGAPQ